MVKTPASHRHCRWGWVLLFLFLVWIGAADVEVLGAQEAPTWPAPGDTAAIAAPESTTSFATTQIVIPTYPYADYLGMAHDAIYNMDYPVLDWDRYNAAHPSPVPQAYELWVLENAYLRVTLLPELGGRIYQIIDKVSGTNQLYQNQVIKPTHWGPPQQGWWLGAGGIEWCLPVDEHGYEWGVPWHASVITTTEGVTVTVQDTYAHDRLRAIVDIFLPNERAYVAISPRIENPTGVSQDFKFWLNAAVAPGAVNGPTEGFAFIFNAAEMSVHSTGDPRLPGAWTVPTTPDHRFTWPIYNGVDYAHLRNWSQWLGFFEYPQAPRDFIGVYDHQQASGLIRVFPHEVARGTKGFAVGWSQALDWHIWTDEPSGGVELHGGLAPTFWDTATLPAHASVQWDEAWYPVRRIGDIVTATREATLGLRKSVDQLHVALHPTRAWASGETELYVWQRSTCEEIAHLQVPAHGPEVGYETTRYVGDLTLDQIAVAFVRANQGDDAAPLVAYGPIDCLDSLDTPSLYVAPTRAVMMVDQDEPTLMTATIEIENTGSDTLTWSATVLPGGTLVPRLSAWQGVQGESLSLTVDTHGLETGVYTTGVMIDALPTTTRNTPQQVSFTLYVVSDITRLYLPSLMRNHSQTISPRMAPPLMAPIAVPTATAYIQGASRSRPLSYERMAMFGASEMYDRYRFSPGPR